MNQFVFANNFQEALAAPITSPTQTIIEVTSTQNIPQIPAGYYWSLTLNDAATQSIFEIVYVTNTSGGNLTVLRGQENTTARTWSTNDLAYSCATAGVLASFFAQAQAGGFVQLSPPAQQTGSINVSGGITAGGLGKFYGADLGGGPLMNVSQAQLSSYIAASNFISNSPYRNAGFSILPIQLNGGSSLIGVGPTSGIAYAGITATALAIGAVNTGYGIAIDINGNLGAAGSLYANSGAFSNSISAPTIYQNGSEVIDTIDSSTLQVTKNGHAYEIDLINSGQVPVGATVLSDGNGGDPTITLPNYGQWFIEVIYALMQTSATNMNLRFGLSGGTITGGFLTNANGYTGTQGNLWITLYGKGRTSVNNQTLSFYLTVSGGSLDPSNQPWTVRATRTA